MTIDEGNRPKELKHCPFCGSPGRLQSDHDEMALYWGECVNCYATSEQAYSIDDAMANWNRRAKVEGEQ